MIHLDMATLTNDMTTPKIPEKIEKVMSQWYATACNAFIKTCYTAFDIITAVVKFKSDFVVLF